MGIDLVELIWEVEDNFEIVIFDDDYPEIRTVGNLHKKVHRQLQAQRELQLAHPTCASVPPGATGIASAL